MQMDEGRRQKEDEAVAVSRCCLFCLLPSSFCLGEHMSTTLNWGILGAGNIAKAFAKGLATSKTGKLIAIGSREQSKADEFAKEFGASHSHGSYESLLADDDVQAVYIATPHPFHAEWAIKAATAKKHLLVEKPIGLNFAEAMAIVEAARLNDVFLMEAFMYRCHPQTQRIVDLIRDGEIGAVRVVQATFSFHSGFNARSRLFNNALGGGGILDVGGYCASMARLIAGAAIGKGFAEPTHVSGAAHLGETGVDEWAVASLKFSNSAAGDILATLSCGVAVNEENVVRIFGTDGHLVVPAPWIPARDGGSTKIALHRKDKAAQDIVIESREPLYSIEADTVARFIDQRQATSPAMSWEDTLGNMKTMDRWRQAAGLIYDSEKPENIQTVSRRPLKVNPKNNMKYGRITGLDKNVSRLVMGVDNQPNLPHAAVMFDDFFERGGNAFDTAWLYGGGAHERLFGQWMKARNNRDQLVLIVKGGHTPHCNPHAIRHQLNESLDRLGTDHADVYIMHRDNPEIPVGEFIEMLNDQVKTGRIKIFGGSNWNLSRVQAANEYARQKGLQGFSVVSNNFSLARMLEPIWGGCISSSDADSRIWFTKTQIPLLAWSSQARGFFVPGLASPEKKEDAELVRVWYSDDNFERLKRVNQLAERRKVLPINVALAYVLNQPFPTYALIGPRQLSETETSLKGLDVVLSTEELKWLNLED
jgi:predicted dehydrogenase/aryl-alcohol dehydrogenase-like predicted oxidoreductase